MLTAPNIHTVWKDLGQGKGYRVRAGQTAALNCVTPYLSLSPGSHSQTISLFGAVDDPRIVFVISLRTWFSYKGKQSGLTHEKPIYT